MKGISRILILAGLSIFGLGATVVAQAKPEVSALANANANVAIVAPLSIQKMADLNFGQIFPHDGGHITISPSGSVSTNGSVEFVPSCTTSAASFSVIGEGFNTFAITLPSEAILTNGADSIKVRNFTSTPSGRGTLNNGTQTVNVGGTLYVNASLSTGVYTGTFTVTVQFN